MQERTDENLIGFTLHRFRQTGAHDRAIRETFDLTNPRYWQSVLAILADPERVGGLPAHLQAQCVRLSRRFAA